MSFDIPSQIQYKKFWDIHTSKILHSIAIPTAATGMLLHRSSDLLAIKGDDLCIRIIDMEGKRVVRECWGHEGKITDMVCRIQ